MVDLHCSLQVSEYLCMMISGSEKFNETISPQTTKIGKQEQERNGILVNRFIPT